MKKKITCLSFCFLICACNIKQKESNELHSATTLSLVLDVTDPKISWPDADQLLQMYHCKEMPNAECTFKLKMISDKRLTPVIYYHLADGESMEKENSESDPQFRNKNITAFYSMVRSAMTDFYKRIDTTQSLNNSECYRAIIDELTLLAENKSDRRILIVASDLMEKSDLLDSYYTPLNNPQELADKLNRLYPVPQNLKGVTMIIFFNPKDRKEDLTFSEMIEVYKKLLQPTGLEIKVQANL